MLAGVLKGPWTGHIPRSESMGRRSAGRRCQPSRSLRLCLLWGFVLCRPLRSRHFRQWPGSRCTGLGRVLRTQSTTTDPECRPPGYQRCLDNARSRLLTFHKPQAQLVKTVLRHAEPTSLQFADFSSAQNGGKVLPAVTLLGLHSMTHTDTPCFSMSRQVQSCHISKTHYKTLMITCDPYVVVFSLSTVRPWPWLP